MTDQEQRGLTETVRLYRATAKGRVLQHYDRDAMWAFAAYGASTCGKPAIRVSMH